MVRTLIRDLSATDIYFEHVSPGGKNEYNKDPDIDYTDFDELEVTLQDGTKEVLFNEPPEFESIREDYRSSETSGPPIYNSDGNEIWDN